MGVRTPVSLPAGSVTNSLLRPLRIRVSRASLMSRSEWTLGMAAGVRLDMGLSRVMAPSFRAS